MVRSTDRPAMTIAVDLGRKSNKTKKMMALKIDEEARLVTSR